MKINYKSTIFLLILVLVIPTILIINSLYVFGEETSENVITVYTESTKTICQNGKCNLVLYSGVRFIYEDDIWKKSEEAISFKNSGIKCVIDSDKINLAECIDWNETSRTIRFSTADDLTVQKNIPLKKFSINESGDKVYDTKFETTVLLNNINKDKTITIKVNPGEYIEYGENSTIIKLQTADVHNLEDTFGAINTPDNSYGAYTTIYVTENPGYENRLYIKWNINTSIIPLGRQIDKAILSIYTSAKTGDLDVSIYHVYDQAWVEGPTGASQSYPVLTWNSQPCGTAFDNSSRCNLTKESTVSSPPTTAWSNYTVTNSLKKEYADGNINFSLVLKGDNEGSGSNYITCLSKENAAAEKPILTIIYSISNLAPVVQLQFPKDGTNSTADSTTFYYNVSDPDENDTVENCSLWLNKNETGFVLDQTDDTITQVINQTFIKSLELGNYIWKVSCYDNATNQGNSSIWSYDIVGINVAPTIDPPTITPDPAYTDDTLSCSTTAYDVNLGSIIIYFDWYKNSVYTAYQNITTTNGTMVSSYLTPGIQNKGEEWNCTVRAYDGEFYSNYESDIITISNKAPTHSNPILNSTSVYNGSNEDLTCYNQNTQDADNDDVVNVYAWYLDSSPLAVLNLPFESNTDDYSGSNNDGVINGTPQYITGKIGNALEFDGIDDKVMVGDIGIGVNGPATIEGWFYFKQFAQGSSYKGLHSGLYQHTTENHLYVPATNELFTVGSVLQLNTWHHIVYTYSGDSATAKLYIDNQEYDVVVQGVGQDIPALTNFLVADRGYDTFFNGSIDEIRVYDRVLSVDEISEHYNLNYDKIISNETSENDVWKCKVTPNDGDVDGTTLESNTVTIEENVYDITFNITEGEYGNDLTGVMIACDNGWSVASTPSNPYGPIKFYEDDYNCELKKSGFYNRTTTFTSDQNKQIDLVLSKKQDMTIEEHNWLEAIYRCLYEGNCKALDLLEQINQTTDNLWDQFKPTDASVVINEDTISNTLSSTQNITIDYTIKAPPKAGYSSGDYAPIRIAYWFLDENNECKDQDKTEDSNRAERSYCIPLIAETLGIVNQEVNFTVELRPNLPAGTYTIVRDIEIDPNQIWIKYGQEKLDNINVLESNDKANIFLTKEEVPEVQETTSESKVKQSSGLSYVTGLATGALDTAVEDIKKVLSGSHIVTIIGMICGLLAVIVICFTIYKTRVGVKRKDGQQ